MINFICPVCKSELFYADNNKTLKCKNGHAFDIAKEGYVYLLEPNQKHSKVPGDDKIMVNSRRSFLESGGYKCFSDKINKICCDYSSTKNPIILDTGCGEGYYTGRIEKNLVENNYNPQVYGTDIAKCAVKSAAKKYTNCIFAVASSFALPVKSQSIDILINIFSPVVPEEFCRVLKKDGIFIFAVPTKRHLFQMKEILYEKPYENEEKDIEYKGFKFIKRETVNSVITLKDSQQIQSLFSMTPYAWKTSFEGKNRLKKCSELTTEIGFDFLIYERL